MMAINVMARVICPISRRGYHLAFSEVSKWWHECQGVVEFVIVDDASVAKMSGGDVDVEPFLVS